MSYQAELSFVDIAGPKEVIHPALDWVDGQLIVGVKLKTGNAKAVLSSERGLIRLANTWDICERGEKFDSPVTPQIAESFIQHREGKVERTPDQEMRAALQGLADYLSRFMVFPDTWWPPVLATWTLGTYLYPMFQAYPYLHITSSVPGCGKTRLGRILASVCFNGDLLTSPTEANVFRLAESTRGTQVWDEIELKDEIEKKRFAAFKAVLLSGYSNGATVPRTEGKDLSKTVRYHVYCPRVLVGLSELPPVLEQRSIKVQLLKRQADEKEVALYIADEEKEQRKRLQSQCILAALKSAQSVRQAYGQDSLRRHLEELLGEAGRRVDDIWLPIFAIATAGERPEQARQARTDWWRALSEAAATLAGREPTEPDVKPAAEPPTEPDVKPAAEPPTEPDVKPAAEPPTEPDVPNAWAKVAVGILEMSGPMEPEKLAKAVSTASGTDVSAQTLSKQLGRIGLHSRKTKGRRVIKATADQIKAAKARLGLTEVEAEPAGQEGQEGQVPQETAA